MTRKRALNDARYRLARQRTDTTRPSNLLPGERFEIVCECADEGCPEQIAIAFEHYEAVQLDPYVRITSPGHFDPHGERPLSVTAEFRLIEEVESAD